MTFIPIPFVAPNTIVPEDEALFIAYFNRIYEDIAFAVNNKDNIYYPMAITDTAQDILNLNNFGSFIICVSGVDSTPPTKTASLCKADATAGGTVTPIGAEAGTGAWAGNLLFITSSGTNFQIRHDRAGVTGNFNIRIIGTQ